MAKPKKNDDHIPWLVMVYMAGDNSLSEDMVLTLQDLMAAGPPPGDRIVAQFDPAGDGLSSQRYEFANSSEDASRSTILEDYRDKDWNPLETNTGTKKNLVDFVKWAVGEAPAPHRKYLLILSGHGSGITDDFFLSDSSSADSLTILELSSALKDIARHIHKKDPKGKLDILGMDACYMAMGEIAYQLRGNVGILIGAEGPEPEFGWPYRRILAAARESPGKTPEALAAMIVEQYVEHHADYDLSTGRSVDLAAIDLDKVDAVVAAWSDLVELLESASQLEKATHDRILLAHWWAQTYKFDQFVDLKDLCEQLKKKCHDVDDLPRKCEAVIAALRRAVILSGCSGFSHQHSYGFSVYFPWGVVSQDYNAGGLLFAEETGWHEFLARHVAATQRDPRPQRLFTQVASPPSHAPTIALDEFKTGRIEGIRRHFGDEVAGHAERALKRQHEILERADILPLDLLAEYGRRLRRVRDVDPAGGSRFEKHTKFEPKTKFEDYTRFISSRERWVKNLTPTIGVAYWGQLAPSGSTSSNVAVHGRHVLVGSGT